MRGGSRPGRDDRSYGNSDRDRRSREGGAWGERNGRRSDDNWGRGGRDDRYRGNDRSWHGSSRIVPRRGWPAYRYPVPRYPSYYRYGYFHRHGYYYPRYYFDYDSHPTHASIRLLVEPSEAEVYVDGYCAGVVDDFDGIFQRLNLTPGSHDITLRLEGYETWSAEVYATPGDTLRLHHDMIPGVSGPEYGDEDSGYRGEPGVYEEPGVNEPPSPYER